MLSPKRVKHRKQHRGRMPGNAKGGTTVSFGEYGLKAVDRGGSGGNMGQQRSGS